MNRPHLIALGAIVLTLVACKPAQVEAPTSEPTAQREITPAPETSPSALTTPPTPLAPQVNIDEARNEITLLYLEHVTNGETWPPVMCKSKQGLGRSLFRCEVGDHIGLWEAIVLPNGHRFIALNDSAKDVVKTMPMEVVEIAPADYPVDVQKALALFE